VTCTQVGGCRHSYTNLCKYQRLYRTFAKKLFKMPNRRVVYSCDNIPNLKEGITLQNIPVFWWWSGPSEEKKLEMCWLRKAEADEWEPTQSSLICSNHFMQIYFAMNFVVNVLFVLQFKNMKLVVCIEELEGLVDRLTVHLIWPWRHRAVKNDGYLK
jgi:hypothetical protein